MQMSTFLVCQGRRGTVLWWLWSAAWSFLLLSPRSQEPGAVRAVSFAQMGLWHDKALQDVFSKSAVTPPTTFYGPEGEGASGLLMLLL